jgi:hypothetical protein
VTGTLFFCCDERRRAQLRTGGSGLTGIDFLEVGDVSPTPADRQRRLRIVFVNPPAAPVRAQMTPATVTVQGGDRVRGIVVTALVWAGNELVVTVDRAGDYSTYTLAIATRDGRPLVGMDPLLSAVDFSFKVECEGGDCLPTRDCAPEDAEYPEIDYLAKDYASFRQLMLDRMSLVLPGWAERNAADLGITLVELLAYTADHLSYRQDAIATEAYLGTARRRVSVKRHARLLDYPMHDGCNARAWVHFPILPTLAGKVYDPHDETDDDTADAATVDAGTQLLTRLVGRPPVLEDGSDALEAALRERPEVFETMHAVEVRPTHNRMELYSWGDLECCLPAGATRATLAGHYPHLRPGDVVVFEEVLGPRTGAEADANPSHRHAVRLTSSSAYARRAPGDPGPDTPATDPAWLRARVVTPGLVLKDDGGADIRPLGTGEVLTVLAPWAGVNKGFGKFRWAVTDADGLEAFVTAKKPDFVFYSPRVTEIAWDEEDALPFALCVSSTTDAAHGVEPVEGVSVARGNVALADHGLSVGPVSLGGAPAADLRLAPAGEGGCGCGCQGEEHEAPPPRWRPMLDDVPVTQAARVSRVIAEGGSPYADLVGPAARAHQWEMSSVLPVMELGGGGGAWKPQRDLLASDAFAREFVLEVEDDGGTALRFGDDRYGRRPRTGEVLTALYRVGNGTAGNVGAGSLTHVVLPGAALAARLSVRNPLPGAGGVDPEPTERVRQVAPAALGTLERAVTPADYAEIAQRHPQVQRAQATMRWTGSWRTVFLTVDRVGGRTVDAAFEAELRRFLERYRMAGHDLEIDEPRYVPLELEIFVCVDPAYYRADVERALREALGRRRFADGREGIFHADRFTFGQSVYLSVIYAAVQGVAGVRWAEVRRLRRQNDPSTDAVASGELTVGRLEVARLDDDRSHPDRGVLRLILEGGR